MGRFGKNPEGSEGDVKGLSKNKDIPQHRLVHHQVLIQMASGTTNRHRLALEPLSAVRSQIRRADPYGSGSGDLTAMCYGFPIPSGKQTKTIENGPAEIVDLPIYP